MRALVTSVRVERLGGHEHVHVWTRGGKAGTLIVAEGDGRKLGNRLFGTGGADWAIEEGFVDGVRAEFGTAKDDGP